MHPNDISYTQKNSYDVERIERKVDIALRYGETLLIYAEALNELSSGTNYEIPSWDDSKIHVVSRNISEMKKAFVRFVFAQDYQIIQKKSIVIQLNYV